MLSPSGTTTRASLGWSPFPQASCFRVTGDWRVWEKSKNITHHPMSFIVTEFMIRKRCAWVRPATGSCVPLRMVMLSGTWWTGKAFWIPWVNLKSEPIIPNNLLPQLTVILLDGPRPFREVVEGYLLWWTVKKHLIKPVPWVVLSLPHSTLRITRAVRPNGWELRENHKFRICSKNQRTYMLA